MIKVSKIKDFLKNEEENKILMVATPTCGACKMMVPIMKRVEQETSFKIFEIDGSENKEDLREYGVQTVPTFLISVKNELKETLQGYAPKEKIVEQLQLLI